MSNILNTVWFFGVIFDELFFPNEIDENMFCPSVFVIASCSNVSLKNKYKFKVVEGDTLKEIKLLRTQEFSDLYFVESGYGRIDFSIKKTKLRYNGKNEKKFENFQLYTLTPIQISKLEILAKLNDFYFVGSSID